MIGGPEAAPAVTLVLNLLDTRRTISRHDNEVTAAFVAGNQPWPKIAARLWAVGELLSEARAIALI